MEKLLVSVFLILTVIGVSFGNNTSGDIESSKQTSEHQSNINGDTPNFIYFAITEKNKSQILESYETEAHEVSYDEKRGFIYAGLPYKKAIKIYKIKLLKNEIEGKNSVSYSAKNSIIFVNSTSSFSPVFKDKKATLSFEDKEELEKYIDYSRKYIQNANTAYEKFKQDAQERSDYCDEKLKKEGHSEDLEDCLKFSHEFVMYAKIAKERLLKAQKELKILSSKIGESNSEFNYNTYKKSIENLQKSKDRLLLKHNGVSIRNDILVNDDLLKTGLAKDGDYVEFDFVERSMTINSIEQAKDIALKYNNILLNDLPATMGGMSMTIKER